MNFVTSDMVRTFLYDRTAEDNPLELDLQWSDEELVAAMKLAALRLHGLPPQVWRIRVDCIPEPLENSFLLMTCAQLMLSLMLKLQRGDFDYSAGGMQVDRDKRRIEYLAKWSEALKTEALTEAKQLKIAENLNQAYGHY